MSQTIQDVVIRYIEQNQSGAIKNMRDMGKESDNTGLAISRIGVAAGAFTVVASAAIAATSKLAAMGNAAATAGDSIGKAAKSLSVTAEELQELRIIAGDSGVAVTELDDALKTFNEKLGEASRGVGEAKEWLDRLNISARNVDGTFKSNVDLFYETGRAVADLASETQRADAMNKIYGGNGYKLVEMFRQTEANIAATIATAREFGAVLSNEVVASAEQYRSKLDLIQQGTEALAVQRGLALAPLTLEWELMKNEVASATINLLEFVGILDVPVTKARARLAEIPGEIDKINKSVAGSFRQGSDIGGGQKASKIKALEDEHQKLLDIVIESDNKLAEAESSARLAQAAREKAAAADRERLAKEYEEKAAAARAKSEAARLAREKAAAAKRVLEVAKAEQQAREQAETNQLEAALSNQIAMQTQLEQMKISAINSDTERLTAQTAFEIEQYEIQNAAALNHISTRMQAEKDFIEFKRLKHVELANELGELSKQHDKEEAARNAEKHAAMLGYANESLSAMSDYFTATGEGSREQKQQIINDLKAMIVKALLFRAIAGLSGGKLAVGADGNLGIPKPNARGGIVNSYSNYDANNTVAEQGPEVILPLVNHNGKMSVKAAANDSNGGGSSVVNLHQSITVNSSNADATEVAKQVQAVARREAEIVYNKNASRVGGRR